MLSIMNLIKCAILFRQYYEFRVVNVHDIFNIFFLIKFFINIVLKKEWFFLFNVTSLNLISNLLAFSDLFKLIHALTYYSNDMLEFIIKFLMIPE